MFKLETVTSRMKARTGIQDCELWGPTLHAHDSANLVKEDGLLKISTPPLRRMLRSFP